MNQKAAKNERRQIRRVIGDDAATLIRDVQDQQRQQAVAIKATQDALLNEIRQSETGRTYLAVEVSKLNAAAHRPFFGRLKWLLRGC